MSVISVTKEFKALFYNVFPSFFVLRQIRSIANKVFYIIGIGELRFMNTTSFDLVNNYCDKRKHNQACLNFAERSNNLLGKKRKSGSGEAPNLFRTESILEGIYSPK